MIQIFQQSGIFFGQEQYLPAGAAVVPIPAADIGPLKGIIPQIDRTALPGSGRNLDDKNIFSLLSLDINIAAGEMKIMDQSWVTKGGPEIFFQRFGIGQTKQTQRMVRLLRHPQQDDASGRCV